MKCEWVRENIVLYVYGDLADDVRHELKAQQDFHALLSGDRAQDPTPNFLAASRMRLQEALETAEQGKWWSRLAFDPLDWLRQVRFSPALAAAILIFGFAGGVGTAYRVYGHPPAGPVIANNPSSVNPTPESSIAGIDSITPVPGTDQVTIKYNTLSSQQTQGSLNDQQIQQLLLYAAHNNYNSGVRVDSVDLLAQKSSESQVRDALIYALENDTNPGVRLKSLDALGNYVKMDTNVRDAVLRTLVNDTNSGVQIEALRLIEQVKADGSVRGVLMALAAKDQSTYIKSQARTMLAQLPEID